jgi:hypothetical protein
MTRRPNLCPTCNTVCTPAEAKEFKSLEARVVELEALLSRAADDIELGWLTIEGVEEKYNTDGSWHVVQDIRAALKEKTI